MWNFHGINDAGEPIGLRKGQKDRRGQYTAILRTAAESEVPSPIFSGYSVRAAIGPVDDEILVAGNVEYGIGHGLHAEECVVAAYRSRRNGKRERRRLVIALIAGEENNPATPCGNCRDILLAQFGSRPELVEIVSGAETGGAAIVTPLSQYFFNAFAPAEDTTPIESLEGLIRAGLIEGKRRENIPPYMERYTPEPYTAIIGTTTGASDAETLMTIHSIGGLDLDAAFHPIYPLEDAIRDAVRKQSGRRLQYAVIVAGGEAATPPHVPYRERQRLAEFQTIGELTTQGGPLDPPIFLIRVKNETITRVWRTSTKAWLPLPFTPKNFGAKALSSIVGYYAVRRS